MKPCKMIEATLMWDFEILTKFFFKLKTIVVLEQ